MDLILRKTKQGAIQLLYAARWVGSHKIFRIIIRKSRGQKLKSKEKKKQTKTMCGEMPKHPTKVLVNREKRRLVYKEKNTYTTHSMWLAVHWML